jgi:hypothetical protein
MLIMNKKYTLYFNSMDALLYCFFNYMCFKFQMFILVDKDKNGFISFREFVDMLIIFAKGKRCIFTKNMSIHILS